jgi:hypothetical protein
MTWDTPKSDSIGTQVDDIKTLSYNRSQYTIKTVLAAFCTGTFDIRVYDISTVQVLQAFSNAFNLKVL